MGILIAFFVLVCWGLHLAYMLVYQPVDPFDAWLWIHIVVQTWLFTGLFITGHDAMHGSISRNRKVNGFLGFTVTILYAGLWYPTLLKKHALHHLHVASGNDPDYHTGNQNFFVWCRGALD